MGGAVGRIFRVVTGAVGGLLSGGPIGAIMGGIGGVLGQGGIGSLMEPLKMFGDLAQKVMGGLGQLGLGGLSQPPMSTGMVQFPYPQPFQPGGVSLPSGGTSSSSGFGAIGGGALQSAQTKFDSAMQQLTSGKELSQQDMLKLQTQIQEANRMFEMMNSIQKSIHDSLKSMIQNIRA